MLGFLTRRIGWAAVSFLAVSLFGLFVAIFGAQRAGIVGILLVLLAGVLALWPVRPPRHAAAVTV